MRIQREENSDLQMNEPSQRTYLSWQRGHHRLVLVLTKDKNNACCKGWGVHAFWKSTDYCTALSVNALFSWIKSIILSERKCKVNTKVEDQVRNLSKAKIKLNVVTSNTLKVKDKSKRKGKVPEESEDDCPISKKKQKIHKIHDGDATNLQERENLNVLYVQIL